MLPATIARTGRPTTRGGYGELLMLNSAIPPLTAYRYSPYTVPSSSGSAHATVSTTCSIQSPVTSLSFPSNSSTSCQVTAASHLANLVQSPHFQQQQQQQQQAQHQQFVAGLGSATSASLLNAVAQQQQQQQQQQAVH